MFWNQLADVVFPENDFIDDSDEPSSEEFEKESDNSEQ